MNVCMREDMAAFGGIPGARDQHKIDGQTRKDVLTIACSPKDEFIRV